MSHGDAGTRIEQRLVIIQRAACACKENENGKSRVHKCKVQRMVMECGCKNRHTAVAFSIKRVTTGVLSKVVDLEMEAE